MSNVVGNSLNLFGKATTIYWVLAALSARRISTSVWISHARQSKVYERNNRNCQIGVTHIQRVPRNRASPKWIIYFREQSAIRNFG
jgi:hypothetical protein